MKNRKNSIFVLIFILLFTLNVKADNIDDNKSKLNDVNNSIDDKQSKIDDINKTKQSTQEIISSLDLKMNDISRKLKIINNKINDTVKQISENEISIKKLNDKINVENDIFRNRARIIYEIGNTGYVQVIFSSTDFSDLISKIYNVQKLMEFDSNLIDDLTNDKIEVQKKENELKKQKANVELLKNQLQAEMKELNNKSSEKKTLMESLEKNKSNYEKMIEAEQQQATELTTTIKNLQEAKKKAEEAAKKKAEEEAKKKAAEEKNSSNDDNNSNGSGETKVINNGKLYCVTGTPYTITSYYGYRMHPVLHEYKFHSGIDIGVGMGTPIYSLQEGTVIFAEYTSGYGNLVMIDHGDKISVYAHNSSLVVTVGQTVKGGQLISYSGSTGMSTGPHLHFEIRKENGDTIDPLPYYIR